jgi:hypothetical protein
VLGCLELAGGARSIDRQYDFVWIGAKIRRYVRSFAGKVEQVGMADPDTMGGQPGHGGGERGRLRRLASAEQKVADSGTLDHCAMLRVREPRVERNPHQPGLDAGEIERDAEQAVVEQQGDALALSEADSVEHDVGKPARQRVDLGKAHPAVVAQHGRSVAMPAGAAADQFGHQHRCGPPLPKIGGSRRP